MPFAIWTRVGPRKHALDEGSYLPGEVAIFRGKDMPERAYPGIPDDILP